MLCFWLLFLSEKLIQGMLALDDTTFSKGLSLGKVDLKNFILPRNLMPREEITIEVVLETFDCEGKLTGLAASLECLKTTHFQGGSVTYVVLGQNNPETRSLD